MLICNALHLRGGAQGNRSCEGSTEFFFDRQFKFKVISYSFV